MSNELRSTLVFNASPGFAAHYPNGRRVSYSAVLVTWADRNAFLGPNPPPEYECDALLVQALIGAPAWVTTTPLRAVNETGWYVIGECVAEGIHF